MNKCRNVCREVGYHKDENVHRFALVIRVELLKREREKEKKRERERERENEREKEKRERKRER